MAARTSILDFSLANELYAAATVSFFTVDNNGAKTATLATLYDAPSGSGTLLNPQTLDSDGKFTAPVYIEDPVIASVSGLTNVDDHDTGVIWAPGTWRGDWATATIYYPNDWIRAGSNADASNDVYIANEQHTSGTFATDVSNGLLALVIDYSSLSSPTLSDDTPAAPTTNGTAGVSADVSRKDHVHPIAAVGTGLNRTGNQLAINQAAALSWTGAHSFASSFTLPATEITIASGVATPTRAHHSVDTESDASNDDLDLIDVTNIPDGGLLILRAENTARTVTVKHNTGTVTGTNKRLFLSGDADYALDDTDKSVILQRRGDELHEIARSTSSSSASLFTESFTSSEITVTAGGTFSVAHGLASQPKLIMAYLVCKTAEHGYSVGDRVLLSFGKGDGGGSNENLGIWLDDTSNIEGVFGTAGAGSFLYINQRSATVGNTVAITNASWKVVLEAWA